MHEQLAIQAAAAMDDGQVSPALWQATTSASAVRQSLWLQPSAQCAGARMGPQ